MRRALRLPLLATAALLAGCAGAGSEAANEAEATGAVEVQTIATLDPAGPGDELAPLRGLLEKARIVGLGESVGHSQGLHDGWTRIVSDLVQNGGVRGIGVDDLDARVAPVNACPVEPELRFSQWGKGSPGLQRLGNWACAWNEKHPEDKVRFFGTSVTNGAADRKAITEWSRTVPVKGAGLIEEGLASCDIGVDVEGRPGVAGRDACLGALDLAEQTQRALPSKDIEVRIVRLRGVELQVTGVLESAQATTAEKKKEAWVAGFEGREAARVKLVEILSALRAPEKRVVLLGSNNGVARAASLSTGEDGALHPHATYGELLARKLGDGYRAVAVSGFDVSGFTMDAGGASPRRVIAPEGSVEQLVRDLGHRQVFVRFDLPRTESSFFDPRAGNPLGGIRTTIPADNYVGMLFIETSRAEEL